MAIEITEYVNSVIITTENDGMLQLYKINGITRITAKNIEASNLSDICEELLKHYDNFFPPKET